MSQFERELEVAGYTGGTTDFYRSVLEAFTEEYPDQSYEWLARRPRRAITFCDLFRASVGLSALEDHTIMGGLENGRKRRIRFDTPFSLN